MPEPVTLDELKLWARVDHDDDEDDLLTALGVAAREFVERATGRPYVGDEAEDVPDLAKVAIKALASHWYEHREGVEDRAHLVVPFHIRAIIHQLSAWSRIEAAQEAEAEA